MSHNYYIWLDGTKYEKSKKLETMLMSSNLGRLDHLRVGSHLLKQIAVRHIVRLPFKHYSNYSLLICLGEMYVEK